MAAVALIAAVSTVTAACTDWFGDENTNPPRFEVIVVNNSEQPIYNVVTSAESTEPAGRFAATRSGGTKAIAIGTATVGDEPGGCFERHLWLVVSRSGETYRQGDIAEYADDFEIIRHFSPGECTDQEQIIVEYDGPVAGAGDGDVGSVGVAPASTDGQPVVVERETEQGRRSNAVQLEFGDSADVDGVRLVVSGVDRVNGATVSLTVRAENRSEAAKLLPGVEVRCLSGSDVVAVSAGGLGAAYEPHADLRAGERAEGTLSVAVPATCTSPAAWPAGGASAFWLLPATAVREPAEQVAHEMIDALDVSAERRTCMHDVVSDFRLSEEDVQDFDDLDSVGNKAEQGDERAIQIMLDLQTALATCN